MNTRTCTLSLTLVSAIVSSSFLLLAPRASAQGSFVAYGSGCAGSSSQICASNNGTTTQTPRYLQNGLTFALKVPASPHARMITGFELYSKAANSLVTINTWLYADKGGKPSTLLASNTMAIGKTLGWYRTKFSSPVSIAANSTCWISYSGGTSKMYFPFVSTGTLGTHVYFWKTQWTRAFTTNAWAWRVNCRMEPKISSIGTPTINKTHTIRLTNAKPKTPAILMIGIKRVAIAWPGAPKCSLLLDPLVLVTLMTDKSGSLDWREPVPNYLSLRGKKFPHQFVVLDFVNAAGLVFSGGGEVRL